MAPKKIKVKPGKAQSKIGFIASLLFVVIGIVIAIPTFGLFGIIWTGLAALIAFTEFKNGFSDEGITTHEIIIDDDNHASDRTADAQNVGNNVGNDVGNDIEAKLIKLNSLYDQRLITREEYDEKRKELLEEF